mmetsp:Transcript_12532/g.30849  ORF Transcript_12532/g.30849 Transcript_12532/m.30849 type:complete len:98 (+) Transcript_12532:555-848(+)
MEEQHAYANAVWITNRIPFKREDGILLMEGLGIYRLRALLQQCCWQCMQHQVRAFSCNSKKCENRFPMKNTAPKVRFGLVSGRLTKFTGFIMNSAHN